MRSHSSQANASVRVACLVSKGELLWERIALMWNCKLRTVVEVEMYERKSKEAKIETKAISRFSTSALS